MATEVTLKRVTRADWLGVLHVEQSLDLPWELADHRDFHAGDKNSTWVAVRDGHVIGFVCLSVAANAVTVERLAVGEGCRRAGIGSVLLWWAAECYVTARRKLVRASVCEYDVAGQLFLRANGFRWVSTTTWAGDVDEYEMQKECSA